MESGPKIGRSWNEIKWTKRCYGYIRVSTKGQVEEGLSLESQANRIKGWAAYKQFEVVDIMKDEGRSGTTLDKRDGLQKLLEIIKEGETLVAIAISRISRSSRDFLNIVHTLKLK